MDETTAVREPVDLRSDTVTMPSDRMREAAANAPVGDDVYGEDPSVNDLEATAAEVLGTEAALYLPSGTMANQTAARVHTERGQEAIVETESHVVRYENAGFAQHSGVQIRPVDAGDRAVPSAAQVADAVIADDLHRPGTGLLCLENTHNAKGGLVATPDAIAAAAEAAHDRDVPVHLDGARLANAAVAADVPLSAFAAHVDSVSLCLSKGLGAPVGTVLAGSEAFVATARGVRKLLGGGMRQAGLIAAPARLALTENVARLADDHANANRLAAGIDGLDGLRAPARETNVVLVDTSESAIDAETFVERCADAGVLGSAFGPETVRFCTHLDVDTAAIETALERIETVVRSRRPSRKLNSVRRRRR
ncbi:LOW QUALITY PROTEIN: low-specificity L-threonine aldolase [Halarchaeum acidiphilum MH1-52-1]|uniref:Low-specificity L-threonine aldolase n=1 Tax=Halarchaeum acidiphilum MH1-52-1 TaxID=1261545 RepID=U3A666_9EURY|nr:LOW QUALITY PROTEIN: low-specificity L-threonine aldolase [Halarchaeum acidiphilum MH1-52-1]